MSFPDYFISCDWGTTNFRLRVVETDSLQVLAEHKTDQGIKVLYEKYREQKETDQTRFFLAYLQEQLLKLPAEHQQHLVVAAGMASANIGLCELDYADLPLDRSGANLVRKHISHDSLELLLISGAKSANGVMRGEETQAIGLAEYLSPQSQGILLLPGTHSKHISYRNGQFDALKTFMTGELFEILSKKSILANSVATSDWTAERIGAFKEGLEAGLNGQLTSSLFSVRARHLLEDYKKEDSYYTLSGMLIGDELSYLKAWKEGVFLAASQPTFSLYQAALEAMVDSEQLVLLGEAAIEKALLMGQKKILQLHDN